MLCPCRGAAGDIVFILLRILLITSLRIVCEAILSGFRSLSRRGGVVLDLTTLGRGRGEVGWAGWVHRRRGNP